MSILDNIKGFIGRLRPGSAKPPAEVTELTAVDETPKAPRVKRPKPPKDILPPRPAVSEQRAFEILRAPHVSEKSVAMMERGAYVFEVARDATGKEIKAAVEKIFEVNVVDVRVANFRGKAKRQGMRNHWKKAHIRLAEGQTLDAEEAPT